jgi:predicted NBD/HSP70 family sugar kinase
MFDWLDSLSGMTDKMGPERVKNTVRLSIVSVVLAIAWLAAASQVTEGTVAWAGALAFITIALIALSVAVVVTLSANQEVLVEVEKKLKLHDRMPPDHHIGCRVGRRRLECGLLHVTESTAELPEASQVIVHDSEDVFLKEAVRERYSRGEVYDALCDALQQQVERAATHNLNVASIGIAIPGGVVPQNGHFDRAVGGFPFEAGEFVSQTISDALVKRCGMPTLQRVFSVEDPESLMQIIHLDNDARCAARWLITEQGPRWTDFVCLFAGTGVGSGLVFDRHVFYGAKFRAGEVGHVDLNMGDKLMLGEMALQPRLCSCGKKGYHFESLVGLGGLGHLAKVLDNGSLEAIERAYMTDPQRASGLRAVRGSEEFSGMILLEVLRRPDLLNLDEITPSGGDLHDGLQRLMELYGQLFGIGITAILDALDLPYIGLCGTIPEYLHGNQNFQWAFRQHLAGNVMGTIVDPLFGNMREWGWRGAALLPRDPDYLNRRFP